MFFVNFGINVRIFSRSIQCFIFSSSIFSIINNTLKIQHSQWRAICYVLPEQLTIATSRYMELVSMVSLL